MALLVIIALLLGYGPAFLASFNLHPIIWIILLILFV
jgi:hypothetical protein